jgi:Na+/H+-dicarboxylate symporter
MMIQWLQVDQAAAVVSQGPLQPLIEIVPENIVRAAADNSSMLQVVFFAIIVGIALGLRSYWHSRQAPAQLLYLLP